MKDFQITIPANGSQLTTWTGKVLSVKTCTLPVTAALDGGVANTIKAGAVLNAEKQFSFVNFVNPNSVAVTIYFFIGQTALNFAPDDNQSSLPKTFVYANLGVADGAAAAGGLPACDADGYLTITAAMGLLVSGTFAGHRRQRIILTVSGSGGNLNIKDGSGNTFMNIINGQTIALDSDADLYLSRMTGSGSSAKVSIGQIFLSQ